MHKKAPRAWANYMVFEKNTDIRQETASVSGDTATRVNGLSSKLKFVKRWKGGLFGVFACLLLVVAGNIFYACNKENEDAIKVQKRRLTKEEKIVIAAMDATGAAIGGAYGGLGGALIGGGGASLVTWIAIKCGAKVKIKVHGTPQLIDDESPANNPGNPYDYIGKIHYLLMNDFLTDSTLYCGADGKFNIEVYRENAANILPNYMADASTSTILDNFSVDYLERSINMSGNPIGTILNDMEIQISPSLINILIAYENYSTTCTSFDAFYTYSISKEQQVLNTTSFTDAEKQIALSYMATLRWGYWYWGNVEFEEIDEIIPPTGE